MEDFGEMPVEQVGSGKQGKWDYTGLAELMKSMIPNPKKGEKKGYWLTGKKVYEYHTEKGESISEQHYGHYAKLAVRRAVELNGWEAVKVAWNGNSKRVEFVVRF